MEGPASMKWAAVPSCMLVNSVMVVFQFCSLCVYYEVVCTVTLKMCSKLPLDKNHIALCVFPLIVFIFFINNSKIISIISIVADILLLAVFCMIIHSATSQGIDPQKYSAFRDANSIPDIMFTALFTLDTTAVVSLTLTNHELFLYMFLGAFH